MDRSEIIQGKIDELKKAGHTIWSFSRLSTFDECQYSYYLKYIKKLQDTGNVYSYAGKSIHAALEKIYKGEEGESHIKDAVLDLFVDLELFEIKFPSESIEKKWRGDIIHFAENFKKRDGMYRTEEPVLFKVEDEWFCGYIDLQKVNGEQVEIYDFKTSSMFKKADMLEKGRQLTLYKMALEQDGLTVGKVAFEMLKYIDIVVRLKNGKEKTYVKNRSTWVKDIQNDIRTRLKDIGVEEFDIEFLIDEAIKNNSIEMLPDEVKKQYQFKPNITEYIVDNDIISESTKWAGDIIKKIKAKNPEKESDWEGKYMTTPDFFCNCLCSFKEDCKYWEKCIQNNEFNL